MTTIQDTLTFPIFGLTDDASVSGVAEALRGVPGVESAHVDLITAEATLQVSSKNPPPPHAGGRRDTDSSD